MISVKRGRDAAVVAVRWNSETEERFVDPPPLQPLNSCKDMEELVGGLVGVKLVVLPVSHPRHGNNLCRYDCLI